MKPMLCAKMAIKVRWPARRKKLWVGGGGAIACWGLWLSKQFLQLTLVFSSIQHLLLGLRFLFPLLFLWLEHKNTTVHTTHTLSCSNGSRNADLYERNCTLASFKQSILEEEWLLLMGRCNKIYISVTIVRPRKYGAVIKSHAVYFIRSTFKCHTVSFNQPSYHEWWR